MMLGDTHRHAVTEAVRRAASVGLVVGVSVALLPGPASAGEGSAEARGRVAVASAATSLARTGSGLHVDSLAVPVATAGARNGRAAAELGRSRVPPFGLVGVTWRSGTAPAGTRVQVRLRQSGGWTGWRVLPFEESEGPAPGEESGSRDGTGPLWAGSADGLAVRVTSETGASPVDVQVVTVDPGAETATTGRSVALDNPPSGDPIVGAPTFPNVPRIITRKEWGADPALTEACDAPRYGLTAKMVFVHHTVNSNDYTPQESPAIVRAIYAYHTQGQQWCDIGYNALVDRFGNIYAGRRGGLRKPVRGAHAGDYNTGTVGVSLIGNFDVAGPSPRMKNALVRFIGWRLGTSYKPVRGTVGINGSAFDRIAGHRDAMSTACPGRYGYAQLPTVRQRVADYLSRYHSPLARRAAQLGQSATGPVWKGERSLRGGFRTVFRNGWMYGKQGLGAHLLVGRVLERYRFTGGPGGLLGWPKSDVRSSPVAGVRVLLAQTGRMYVRGPDWLKVVHGPIFERYRSMGFADSRLGFPVTNVMSTDYGQRSDFQHGTIRWDRKTDETTVSFS